MEICAAGSLDMNYILELYQQAFPKEERKPFSVIERKASMGSMEILLIKEERKRVGLAITAVEGDMILLDYFAVDEKNRGQGIGAEALMFLRALYNDRQLFLEIEEPDDTAANQMERIRRKEFYLRNGMLETGIRIRLFGVSMEILCTQPGLTFEKCGKLYREMYGPMYQKVVELVEECQIQ